MRRSLLYGIIILVVLAVAVGIYIYVNREQTTITEKPATPAKEEEAEEPSKAETPSFAQVTGNSCVDCHRNIPAGTFAGHSFRDWEESPHAKNNVACEACHGGDPEKTDAKSAHIGVYSSRNPQSPVYFKNIPQTCGGCHKDEFNRFRASLHFTQLQEMGRGPNCITCHGSMAISILKPTELEASCSVCHNERLGIRPSEPIKARFVEVLMSQTQAFIDLVEELIQLKKTQGVDTTKAEAMITSAKAEMGEARKEWHTFNVEKIEGHISRAFALAQSVVKELSP